MFWRKKPVVEIQSSNRILYENQILQLADQLTQYGVTEFTMKAFRNDMTSGKGGYADEIVLTIEEWSY